MLNEFLQKTENELVKNCDLYFYGDSQVNAAARYSLLNAGKRVRAMFIYLTAQMCGKEWEDYTDLACGVEMIHCYSLIHDDLPCMDDDDLRRGKPSCHKAFPENIALLAGDALIGCGIETVANSNAFSVQDKLKAVTMMCAAMGPKGMIYGQELDLKYETEKADREQLALIHKNKTGQLISLCGKLGSLGCDLTDEQQQAIRVFFANTGLVFQIVDDILDVEGSEEELGKPIGSDSENGKSTFITLYGLEDSKKQVEKLTKEANELLYAQFGEKADNLVNYTKQLAQRKK
ncbi:MAG: polyprenyl synthetase family protein [Ruminococcaceae bacterium]|nr:polyprenyl synthetase family protein [Oscillospiraceae bacterium]